VSARASQGEEGRCVCVCGGGGIPARTGDRAVPGRLRVPPPPPPGAPGAFSPPPRGFRWGGGGVGGGGGGRECVCVPRQLPAVSLGGVYGGGGGRG